MHYSITELITQFCFCYWLTAYVSEVSIMDWFPNLINISGLPSFLIQYLGEWAIAAHGMYESNQV